MGKELVVKEPPEFKPQYGGRSLVEKVTAYKLSNGELVEGKENAVRRQKSLDKFERVELLIRKYLRPFKATPVDEDGRTLTIEENVVNVYDVRDFLFYCAEIKL